MSAMAGESIGRLLKATAFAQAFDAIAIKGGGDPKSLATAQMMVEQLSTATPDDWARLTMQLNATGRKLKAPSEKTQAALVALYRTRAGQPVTDLDAADLALQIERRLVKLANGEQEAEENAATVARYVAWFDKRRVEQGRDPHNPGGCIDLAYEMGQWTRGRWWYRSKDVGEKFAPNEEVVRLVRNVYLVRGGSKPREPNASRANVTAADDAGHQDDVALLAEAMSPASRAEQLDVQDEIDREQERKQRFGGGRR